MVCTFLLDLLVAVHSLEEVADIADEALALGEVIEGHDFPAVRALGPPLLDPLAQALLAGHLAAAGAHPWLLQPLEADVAVQEGRLRIGLHFPQYLLYVNIIVYIRVYIQSS